MKKNPLTYAVVLNYNGYDDTVRCVKSLSKAGNNSIRIIIVDNASVDGSGLRLKDMFPEITLIFSPKNGGYAAGINLGITYALNEKADIIILINNDTKVRENFLEPIFDEMTDDNVGVVSGKVLYLDKPDIIYCAGGRIDYLRCTGVAEFQGKNGMAFANERREISLAEGSFLAVRKEVFKKIGLFEEKYFMYLEDVDFSMRVAKHFKIIYTNRSIIYHRSGAGASWDEFTPLYSYYYTRNRLWYFCDYFLLYRLYVIVFSLMVSFLKSLKMFQSFIFNPDKRVKLNNSFISLWKGTKDGILLILRIKNS
jgi:GT2 family glycosyltransferase